MATDVCVKNEDNIENKIDEGLDIKEEDILHAVCLNNEKRIDKKEEKVFNEKKINENINKTPFGINRYILLIVTILYTFATARVYFGWPNLSNMLFRSDAYIWLCEKNEEKKDDVEYMCIEQYSAVQLLFTYVTGVSFCCSLFSGILLDYKGPKITAICGQILNFLAWIILAFSKKNGALYICSMILMGLGADAGFLPATNICYLFPKNEKLIIALISAAMSASFAIPTILDIAWKNNSNLSLQILCFYYAGFGPALACIIAALFFPYKIYVFPNEEECIESKNNIKNDINMNNNIKEDIFEKKSIENAKKNVQNDMNMNNDLNNIEEDNIKINFREDDITLCSDIISHDINKKKSTFKSQIYSKYFYIFYIYWPLNAVFYNYYLSYAAKLFGQDVNNALGIMGPISLVPSIILGKIADMYGVMYLIIFIIFSALLMYIFATIQFITCFYISAIASMFYVSCFSGQMYSYVNDTFAPIHYGKIVGIISATGGILSLIFGLINKYIIIQIYHTNSLYVVYFMLFLVIICCFLVAYLFYIKNIHSKAYYIEQKQNQKNIHSKS